MNIQRMKEKRAILLEEVQEVVKGAEKESRSLTTEEREAYDNKMQEVKDLGADIARVEQLADERARNMKKDPEKDKAEWRSLGEFVQAVASNPNDKRLRGREVEIEGRAQTMGNGPEGGFLVPDNFASQILQVSPDEAIIRPRATVFQSGDADLHIPAIRYSGNNMFGGAVVDWIDEAEEKPETDVEFKRVTLHPFEVAAHVRVTDKLLRNTNAIEGVVTSQLRNALINAEEAAFLTGTGIGQPTGIIDHAATITVARAGAGVVDYADLVNMYQRFRGRTAGWIINRAVLGDLMTMEDTGGSLLWQPNARNGQPGTIFGYPVYISDNSPALGDQGDVVLADLSNYLIGDGAGITIAASPHMLFTNNITVIKAFKTVDGTPWLLGPLPTTPTTSPFVELDA